MNRLQFMKIVAGAAVLAQGAVAMGPAFAAGPMGHIRGTILAVTPDRLMMKTSEGNVSVAIDSTTRIAGVVGSSLDQIKSGTFVGIANVPGKASSRALEVVVFPDAMKGTGLGDYPWDLAPKAGRKASAMTNGTVTAASAGGSAMTNGTVTKTSEASGLLLAVDYGKGEKKIRVPAGVPVVGIVPGDTSKLVPGAHVFVSTRKDAPQTAGFIAVGVDGTVPPM